MVGKGFGLPWNYWKGNCDFHLIQNSCVKLRDWPMFDVMSSFQLLAMIEAVNHKRGDL